MQVNRNSYIFYCILEQALEDEVITFDEHNILEILRAELSVSKADGDELREVAKGTLAYPFDQKHIDRWKGSVPGDKTVYQTVLIAALDDENISEDEWAMLNVLKSLLKISNKDHRLIEEAITYQGNQDDKGHTRQQRLERLLGVLQF